MGFLDPKDVEDGDELPGSGLELDLEVKVCPRCGRESLPWQARCEDCGVRTVVPGEVPPTEFALPHLEGPDDTADDGTDEDADTTPGEEPEAG